MEIQSLIIPEKKDTPSITFDIEKNFFEIKGNSYPEDAAEFYNPIIEWLLKFSETDYNKDITFIFDLEYYNTSSEKYLIEVMKAIKQIREKGINIKVQWRYAEDDIEALENGEEYKMTVGIPFEFYKKEKDLTDEIDDYF